MNRSTANTASTSLTGIEDMIWRNLVSLVVALVASVLLFCTPARATTYAVLIGCSSYGGSGDLNGPEVDVRLVRSMLTSYYGVSSRNIYSDSGYVSRDSVSRMLSSAYRRMTRGDVLILYFSGHGSQTSAYDEDDGMDECWVLSDHSRVLDDSVQRMGRDLNNAGITFWCVSDSCFAGGMNRSKLGPKIKTKALPSTFKLSKKTLVPPYVAKKQIVADKVTKSTERMLPKQYPSSGLYARSYYMFACREHEKSGDTPRGGLFTRALSMVVDRDPYANFQQVFNALNVQMTYYEQSPRFVGTSTGMLFRK